jgi:hypothetical protein
VAENDFSFIGQFAVKRHFEGYVCDVCDGGENQLRAGASHSSAYGEPINSTT